MRLDPLLYIAGFLLALGLFVFLVSRAGGTWVLDVRDGEVTVRRGDPPPRLLRAIRDVVAEAPRGRIIGRPDGSRIALELKGFEDGTAQRLRNVLGVFQG